MKKRRTGQPNPKTYSPWLLDLVSAVVSLSAAAWLTARHHPFWGAAFVVDGIIRFAKRHALGSLRLRALVEAIAFMAIFACWRWR